MYDKVYHKNNYTTELVSISKCTKYEVGTLNQTIFIKVSNTTCFTTDGNGVLRHIIYIGAPSNA